MKLLNAAINSLLLHAGAVLGVIFRQNYHKNTMRGRQESEKSLMRILRTSQNTEFGKKYGFADIRNAKDYQNAVPLTTYEDYRSYIERTAKTGEQGLITGHKVNYFATTSGTVGMVKLIPQITTSYIPYFKFICIALDEMIKAIRKRGVSAAVSRGLLVTEVKTKNANQYLEDGGSIPTGVISSYAAGGVGIFLPLFTPFPREVFSTSEIEDMKYIKARYGIADPDLKWFGGVFMSALADLMTYIETHNELLIRDIETGTISPFVKMTDNMRARLTKKLHPNPKRAAELRQIFNTPSETPLIMRIWPKMSFICSIGTGDFEPFTKKMRTYCTEDVTFHFGMYAASESAMGIALHSEETFYLLLLESGFFEFLPEKEDGSDPAGHPLLLDELEVGKRYEIVVTNLSGLYRYRLRDVVRVKSYDGQVPCIEFAYRANHVTDLCGSHITGANLADAIGEAEKALGIPVEDFSLYADHEYNPPRIELFVELNRTLSAEELTLMEKVFDETLQKSAWDYGYCRKNGILNPAVIRLAAKGTFSRYRDMRIAAGASVNQLKAVRVLDSKNMLDFFRAAVIDTEIDEA